MPFVSVALFEFLILQSKRCFNCFLFWNKSWICFNTKNVLSNTTSVILWWLGFLLTSHLKGCYLSCWVFFQFSRVSILFLWFDSLIIEKELMCGWFEMKLICFVLAFVPDWKSIGFCYFSRQKKTMHLNCLIALTIKYDNAQ